MHAPPQHQTHEHVTAHVVNPSNCVLKGCGRWIPLSCQAHKHQCYAPASLHVCPAAAEQTQCTSCEPRQINTAWCWCCHAARSKSARSPASVECSSTKCQVPVQAAKQRPPTRCIPSTQVSSGLGSSGHYQSSLTPLPPQPYPPSATTPVKARSLARQQVQQQQEQNSCQSCMAHDPNENQRRAHTSTDSAICKQCATP